MRDVPWESGQWTRAPARVQRQAGGMLVTAEEGSDYWRETSYGFIHDNGHGLLAEFADNCAIEVSFICDYTHQFDQAGVLIYADERTWVKAAVEFADGAPQLGAVVTREMSDWSLAPCPDWAGQEITVRASRSGNALTIRAKAGDEWRLVRVAPIDPALAWRGGPLVNAPLRAGLTVRFTAFRTGPADESLHPETGH